MTNQKDLNKDFVALFSTLTDSVHKLKEAVSIINVELKDFYNLHHNKKVC